MSKLMWVLFFAFVILVVLGVLGYQAADRPGDDFGAAAPMLICIILAIACAFIWVCCAIAHFGFNVP